MTAGPSPGGVMTRTLCTGLVVILTTSLAASDDPKEAKPVYVLIETEKGDIEVELDAAKAPVTVANFLKYVDGQGFAAFGRVVKGMDVMKKIQQAPADGQMLKPPVKIIKMS